MKKLILSSALQLLVISLSVAQIIQLTDNNRDDRYPFICQSKMVYQGFDGNDFEIYSYDLNTKISTQITNNVVDDKNPKGNTEEIVWQQFDGNDYEIKHYTYGKSSTVSLTDNDFHDSIPLMRPDYPGVFAWLGKDGRDYDVFLYYQDSLRNITNDDLADTSLSLSNEGNLNWSHRSSSRGLFSPLRTFFSKINTFPGYCHSSSANLYNTSTSFGATTMFYKNNLISEAWVDIYARNVNECIQISERGASIENVLNGQGNVTWLQKNGADNDVMLYKRDWYDSKDLGKLISLTQDSVDQKDLNISWGTVLWAGYDGTDYEIYAYNNGKIYQITNNDKDDFSPNYSNYGFIFWTGMDETDSEIFMVNFNEILSVDAAKHPKTINVFPNPISSQDTRIELGNPISEVNIVWMNSLGQIVGEEYITSSQATVPSGLEKGVYIIHLLGTEINVRTKVLIE